MSQAVNSRYHACHLDVAITHLLHYFLRLQLQLAALHFNENCGCAPAVTKEGNKHHISQVYTVKNVV